MKATAVLLFVTCACELFPAVAENVKWSFYKNTFRLIIRFHSRPIKNYFEKVPSAKEERDKQPGWYKRDSIVQADNETGMFHSEIQNFPVDTVIGDAMFKLFGKEGILAKGGFDREGVVHSTGEGMIFLHKGFGNRTNLLFELEKSIREPFTSSVLSLITQLLFSPEDLRLLLQFEKDLISSGNLKSDDPCSPRMKINYKCCAITTDTVLQPKFATLSIAVD